MAWICVNDLAGSAQFRRQERRGAPNQDITKALNCDRMLTRGTLVLDFDLAKDSTAPKRLCNYERQQNWRRSFTVFLNPDNSISVQASQGAAQSYVRLSNWQTSFSGRARLSYSWDAPKRLGLLTVECLNSGSIRQAVFENPIPIPLGDALRITANRGSHLDAQVGAAQLSDDIEPIGPMPGISAGTHVETEDGPRCIETLRLGDKVVTARHGLQPVRWILRQELPATISTAPIRLRAPYLGLISDIRLAPQQRIMLQGTDAEYLFGEDQVLVETRQLLHHSAARTDSNSFSNIQYQVLLDVHDCIQLGGLWCESIFIGNLAASPDILATTLFAALPTNALPVHRSMKRPILRPHETMTLLDALGA